MLLQSLLVFLRETISYHLRWMTLICMDWVGAKEVLYLINKFASKYFGVHRWMFIAPPNNLRCWQFATNGALLPKKRFCASCDWWSENNKSAESFWKAHHHPAFSRDIYLIKIYHFRVVFKSRDRQADRDIYSLLARACWTRSLMLWKKFLTNIPVNGLTRLPTR